jgi:hypothetical protein
MKNTKKRTGPAERKSAVPAKQEHVAALEGRAGHWTQWIKPDQRAFISQTLRPCHLVIQNHGPGNIKLFAGHGDSMELAPGNLRATYVAGEITVENTDNKSAVVELELLSIFIKY